MKYNELFMDDLHKIDGYISRLQVYDYVVRINNHSLGDFHNITVFKFVKLSKPWYKFWQSDDIYSKTMVMSECMRIPSDLSRLYAKFEVMLHEASRK